MPQLRSAHERQYRVCEKRSIRRFFVYTLLLLIVYMISLSNDAIRGVFMCPPERPGIDEMRDAKGAVGSAEESALPAQRVKSPIELQNELARLSDQFTDLYTAAKAVALAAWTDRHGRLHGHETVVELNRVLTELGAHPASAASVFLARARHLIELAEAAENKSLDGDEGCVWPVEALRAAYRDLAQPLARQEDEYSLGRRDGYEQAIQDIDRLTGGDGEFVTSTDGDGCPDANAMKDRILERFVVRDEVRPVGRVAFTYQSALGKIRSVEWLSEGVPEVGTTLYARPTQHLEQLENGNG